MWTISGLLVVILLLHQIARMHERSIRAATARAALAESLLEASPAAMLILDDRGFIVRGNRSAARLFGYQAGAFIDQHYSLLIPMPAEDDARHARQQAAAAALASSGCCDVQGSAADGTTFTVQLQARSIELDGTRRVIAHFRDLTAEKQVKGALGRHIEQLLMTKEALQQHNATLESVVHERTEQLSVAKDAADRANAAKSEFLANMSHELRTPLHGVLSFARFGVQRYASVDREKLLTYFQRIETTGQSLLRLLNDLLDLAKLEAGAMTLECESVELTPLVSGVVEEFAALAREKQLALHWTCSDTPQQVWGDREKLAQVIRNLIGNAAKFTPAGGEICVSVSGSHDAAQIDVRDNGPGIPDSECEAIFDKFVQSHATNNGAGGTGLGLPICRQIIQLHQGTIFAEPTHGSGALIRVTLPRWTPIAPGSSEISPMSVACVN